MLGRGKDRTGLRLGLLTCEEPTARRVGGEVVWKLRCDCGGLVERPLNGVIVGQRQGCDQSCGCINRGCASPLAMDLTGHRSGRLVILRSLGSSGGGLRWLARCSCGNTVKVRNKEFRNGTTKSCGCLRSEPAARSATRPGDRYGQLVVREQVKDTRGYRQFVCACDCGRETVVRGTLLRNGQTKSCGCLRSAGYGKAKAARERSLATAGAHLQAVMATAEARLAISLEERRAA